MREESKIEYRWEAIVDRTRGMASQRRAVSSVKSGRVAQRLKQRIDDGDFYEAHQTYKVLYQRYCAQGKKEAALKLLYDGAATLLRHSQWESGTELAIQLTRHLKQELTPVSKELLDMMVELFSLYAGSKDFATDIPAQCQVKIEVDPREHFMRAALKWTSVVEDGRYKYGHPTLHRVLATTFLKEKQLSKAREHFLYAGDPRNFGLLLVEMAGSERQGVEALITGAVLQLLVLQDLSSATSTYATYTSEHCLLRDLQGPPYSEFPILNILHSLLQACEKGDVESFKNLRGQHETSLASVDPIFSMYLDKIGVVYFNQPSGESQSSNGIAGGGAASGLMSLLGGSGQILENLIGNISNAIPDPPFLHEDGYLPSLAPDFAGSLMNGVPTSTNLSGSSLSPAAVAAPVNGGSSSQGQLTPQLTLPLTIDEDTLD